MPDTIPSGRFPGYDIAAPWQSYALPENLLNQEVPPLVLGSVSARRRDLIRAFGLSFTSRGAEIPEERLQEESPEKFALRLALEKAATVACRTPGSCVLGADTVVVGLGMILGKPSSQAQAGAMLRLLSGRTHRVVTGVALVCPSLEIEWAWWDITYVTFRHLSWAEIGAYIQTGEPMDKAGAYGIQGLGGRFVSRLRGSYTNVVGLPMESVREALIKLIGVCGGEAPHCREIGKKTLP